jgi:hypothetical protein
MDLVTLFTYDIEAALARSKEVTMFTLDVQEAFNALLKKRLLRHITKQGWPLSLLQLTDSFLLNRQLCVRLEKKTTKNYQVKCGTLQGLPLSLVLYILYLTELLNQDKTLCFGYADNMCLYQASKLLDENVKLLTRDIRGILS